MKLMRSGPGCKAAACSAGGTPAEVCACVTRGRFAGLRRTAPPRPVQCLVHPSILQSCSVSIPSPTQSPVRRPPGLRAQALGLLW